MEEDKTAEPQVAPLPHLSPRVSAASPYAAPIWLSVAVVALAVSVFVTFVRAATIPLGGGRGIVAAWTPQMAANIQMGAIVVQLIAAGACAWIADHWAARAGVGVAVVAVVFYIWRLFAA